MVKTQYPDLSFTQILYSLYGQPIDSTTLAGLGITDGRSFTMPAGGREVVKIDQRKAGDLAVATFYLYDAAGNLTDVWQPVARLKRDPIADLPIAAHVDQVLQDQDISWRDRLLPPLVTLRLFVTQILHGNCAIPALRQLCGLGFAISSYVEARGRLPLQLLESLLQLVNEQARETLADVPRLKRRVFIADASTYSMSDTPQLSAHFDLPPGTQVGVGYPMGKLLGLIDLATGMFVSLLAVPLFAHEMRDAAELHPMLRAGDILVADRAFCTYVHLAMLQIRGVFACMHLHQLRKDQTPGRQRWHKPRECCDWMDAARYALLPLFIDVRIVRYTIEHPGFRTRHVLVATTLMDEVLWPDHKIAELYGHRWNIETCFDYLTTTMNMNVLRFEPAADHA